MRLRLLFGLPLLLMAAPVRAEPPPKFYFRLHYDWPRGVGCPVEYAMQLYVGEVIAYDPFPPDGDHHAVILVKQEAEQFRAKLTLWTPTWHEIWRHELTHRNCNELMRTVATSFGVGLLRLLPPLKSAPPPASPAPPALPSPPPSSSSSTEETTPPAAPPPAAAAPATVVTPAKKEVPSSSWGLVPEFTLGLWVSGFRTPSVLLGPTLAVGLRIREKWSVAVEGRNGFPLGDDEVRYEGKVHRFQSDFVSGILLGCYRPEVSRQYRVYGLVCGALELGYRSFASKEGSFSEDAAIAAAVGLRLGLHWSMTRHFFFRGYSEALINMTPYNASVIVQEFWRTKGPPVAGGIGVGITLW